MFREIVKPALVIFVVLSAITGIAYPLIVTAIAQAAFPGKANGSLVYCNGNAVGSALVGQNFDDPKYFWGRPSATTHAPYHGTASGGSNLAPTNPALVNTIGARVERLRAADPQHRPNVPVDLVTFSGSGLDPHISPAAADYQVPRVAKARGFKESELRALVARHSEGRVLGLFGEPSVNVLKLNLSLDQRQWQMKGMTMTGILTGWLFGALAFGLTYVFLRGCQRLDLWVEQHWPIH